MSEIARDKRTVLLSLFSFSEMIPTDKPKRQENRPLVP
jgi:hypothetical protein